MTTAAAPGATAADKTAAGETAPPVTTAGGKTATGRAAAGRAAAGKKTIAGKVTPPDPAPDPEPEPERASLLRRPVLWIGVIAGTASAVEAIMHGVRFPGLEIVLSVLVTWLLLVPIAVTAAELLRRHHQAIVTHGRRGIGHGWRYGRRGLAAGAGAAAGWARARWARRDHQPLMFGRRHPDGDGDGAGDGDGWVPPPPVPYPPPPGPPPGTPFHRHEVGAPCDSSCNPPPPPETRTNEGTPMPDTRVHDHSADGWDDPLPYRLADPPPAGGKGMPVTRASGRQVPPVLRAVASWIDDFESASDAELHDFLLGLAAGLHDVGASLNDLYELCTAPGIRIGKGGMNATHEAADSIAEAAGGVSGASKALEAYYQGVSEEVADGVELPRDGDFLTGHGAGS